MQQAEVLVDAVLVRGAVVEDVEGGVEEEGEFEVGAGGAGVGGEEGDVEGLVLRAVSDGDGGRRGEGGGRGTCLPIMPMQAIEGVEVMAVVGGIRGWKVALSWLEMSWG